MRRALLETVVLARGSLAGMKAELERRKTVYDETNTELVQHIANQRKAVAEAEGALVEAALAAFKETEDKTGHPGVTIQEHRVVVYESSLALDWGIEHDIAVIPVSLDAREFEQFMKATKMPPSFVQFRKEYTAALARDMTKALENLIGEENGSLRSA